MMRSSTSTSPYIVSMPLKAAVKRIRAPHDHDVLSGRGGGINSHVGNQTFREWVRERKEDYNLAASKAEKAEVVNQVIARVKALTPPGRFLQRDPTATTGPGWWIELDETKMMAKTSQALREGAPRIRAAHKDELDEKKKKNDRAVTRSRRGNASHGKNKKRIRAETASRTERECREALLVRSIPESASESSKGAIEGSSLETAKSTLDRTARSPSDEMMLLPSATPSGGQREIVEPPNILPAQVLALEATARRRRQGITSKNVKVPLVVAPKNVSNIRNLAMSARTDIALSMNAKAKTSRAKVNGPQGLLFSNRFLRKRPSPFGRSSGQSSIMRSQGERSFKRVRMQHDPDETPPLLPLPNTHMDAIPPLSMMSSSRPSHQRGPGNIRRSHSLALSDIGSDIDLRETPFVNPFDDETNVLKMDIQRQRMDLQRRK
mmetsp:Transcript_15860/g.43792  ORF Transcript_15860/g.43792 Transcript_15860/m.43792 type:complete len:436 (-) Transcript_15860:314-1621(-)|eukprot:CAMPEP_0198113380 /NCGR_PEP_ID=MMETSP1442-20131203/5062_1 /TAXON_ID= /ORGANISM="Craspedostauros australis, Strain CCMP3328" /LENGTH=435 /DNA_ID=CAMNT_0043770449 /DNA_START=561 /DNA_END=1868 /DNA_ORIENTATION=+